MEEIFSEIRREGESLSRVVLSSPGKKGPDLPGKITLRKTLSGAGYLFTAEEIRGEKAYHKSFSPDLLFAYLEEKNALSSFRQWDLFTSKGQICYRISKKGKLSRSFNAGCQESPAPERHNREKAYLIREGDPVPFLVDLGIFTKEMRPVASKYDKFRQINRFLEIVDHALCDFPREEITVLDFGCGKSYLTFLLYYYFAVLKKKRVRIIGYDKKEDVVKTCNDLAKKYGYHGLSFVVADVTRDDLTREKIDMVISLHACDVATDHALHFALEREVPYIFSVPCCQHEIGEQIRKGDGDLDLFLSHGIFKERLSSLLTDTIRARILEAEGYKVDVLEFVDFSHSPKNLMLRAKRAPGKKKKPLDEIGLLEKRYQFTQTLYHLRKGETQ